MNVSFDGLRKQLVEAYEKTVHGYVNVLNDNGYDKSFDELKYGLDDIRKLIFTLLCCSDPKLIESENDFHDFSDMVYSLISVDNAILNRNKTGKDI